VKDVDLSEAAADAELPLLVDVRVQSRAVIPRISGRSSPALAVSSRHAPAWRSHARGWPAGRCWIAHAL